MTVDEAVETAQLVRLTGYEDCREVFRHRGLRQALYDQGEVLMHDVVVNLHGAEHRDRRRLENRLFRRDVFLSWERTVTPGIVERVLAPAVAAGRGDLIDLARRAMMTLAAGIAGVDLPEGDDDAFEALCSIMLRLSRTSTVIHATGDKPAIIADGVVALDEFDERFFQPSLERRRALLAASGTDPDALPRDVLSTLLVNQDALDLPPGVVLREVAYFPWVGSHSTANAFAHAMDHIFNWLEARPEDRALLEADPALVQRFAHETLRLHPPTPEARRHALEQVALPSGIQIPVGAEVVIDFIVANRDVAVFGPTAEEFDPYRPLPEGVSLWGLAFGSGFHACLGQELAGGVPPGAEGPDGANLYGSISTMARILLEHGARRDPDHPPVPDAQSRRPHFGQYPILLS